MMNIFIDRLTKIQKTLVEFFDKKFENEIDELTVNKTNKKLIENIIIDANRPNMLTLSEKEEIITKALMLLAQFTGCAEDSEMAEEILNEAYFKSMISKQQLDTYYENIGTKRWE